MKERFRDLLGARVLGRLTRFATWAHAHECSVRLFGEDGHVLSTHSLDPKGDGLFVGDVAGIGDGALYKFVLDGKELPDPYARSLPKGVHGPARVVSPSYVPKHARPHERPLSRQVIYELHVGTFTREGTYAAAGKHLRELVRLGVTTIELLPVASFAGSRGWGYDGVALFAPFAPYGTPDELREFVDAAHGEGLGVLLDVVYNHFGPAGNYLSAYHPGYFTNEVKNAWGDAPDYRQPAMRELAIGNAVYWIEEFGFDGLRLDAVHAIGDPSPEHLLVELTREVRAVLPNAIVIAEDERNDPATLRAAKLDANWADDFHHQVRVSLTGESDGYYAAYRGGAADLAETLRKGWFYDGRANPTNGETRGAPALDVDASAFVYCIQNHDQVGNRALGTRLSQDAGIEGHCLASTILLFAPMTPLLFMGQEWAASSPFLFFTDHDPELGKLVREGRRSEFAAFRAFADPETRESIPDPQAVETFERSKLDWSERDREPHARVLALYRKLLALRREDPVLFQSRRDAFTARAVGNTLIATRTLGNEVRVLVANLDRESSVELSSLGIPRERTLLLSSAEPVLEVLAPLRAAVFAARG